MRRLFLAYVALFAALLASWGSFAQLTATGVGGGGFGAGGGGGGYTGPGDVVSGAVGWWGLRGYSAAYAAGNSQATSPAIRVMDQAGANPLVVEILTNGDINVSRISTWVTANSVTTILIDQFFDQSGHGLHFQARGTISIMPILTLSGLGAHPISSWTTSDVLDTLSTGSLTQSQPFVLSTVAERTGNFSSEGDFIVTLSPTVSYGFINSTNSAFLFAGSVLSATAADSAYHAIQMTGNDAGSGSEIYVDGTPTGGSAGTNGFANTLSLGNLKLTGNLLETGIWPGTWSSGQKSSMNGNQHTYWGF